MDQLKNSSKSPIFVLFDPMDSEVDRAMTSDFFETIMNVTVESTTPVIQPDGITDHEEKLLEQLSLTRFIVMKILVPIILSAGVIGNVMNMAVLTRRWMRSSTNYYLTILALYDVLYLIFVFTLIVKHYTDVTGLKWYNYYKYHVGVPLTNICSNTGVWLTLTFTIERYIGVCYPMKGKAWCTPERAKYIILVVCTAVVILTTPDFFAMRVKEKVEINNGQNVTKYAGEPTDLGSRLSFSVGYGYVTQVLFTFLPLVLLMAFNSLLIRAVMVAARQRRSMAQLAVVQSERQERHNRDQHRITVMLITVVIVFLVCQSPQAIQHIYRAYLSHKQGDLTNAQGITFTITANVFNLFVIINASTNFILYSAFSTKFRRTFSRVFCRCIQQSRRNPHELLFSEAATAQSSPPDESKTHLLHCLKNKNHLAYKWSGSHTGMTESKGTKDNNRYRNSSASYNNSSKSYNNSAAPKRNGYMGPKQNGESIISCV